MGGLPELRHAGGVRSVLKFNPMLLISSVSRRKANRQIIAVSQSYLTKHSAEKALHQ
jgi:hypothetical protein